jgi:hypothetical protein
VILAAALAALLASTPSADVQKPKLDKVDFTLLAADVTIRGLDAYSTRHDLNQGDRERFLPSFVVSQAAPLITFEASMVGVDYVIASELTKHHHSKLAKLALSIDLSATTPYVINNLLLGPPIKESPCCNIPKTNTGKSGGKL